MRTFTSGKRDNGEFLTCCLSPKAEWAYCGGEDKVLYCFNMLSGSLEQTIPVKQKKNFFENKN